MDTSDGNNEPENKEISLNPRLRAALKVLQDERFHQMNDGFEEAEPHEFTPKFERKMEQLIDEQKNKDKENRSSKKKTKSFYNGLYASGWKKAAAIAIMTAGITGIVGVQADAIRMPKIHIIAEMYDNYIGVRIDPEEGPLVDAVSTMETLYEPGWMPGGYHVTERNIGLAYYKVSYKKKNGITLKYYQYYDKTILTVDSEGRRYQTMVIDDKIYYYTEGKTSTLLWYENGYRYKLTGSENINHLVKISDRIMLLS